MRDFSSRPRRRGTPALDAALLAAGALALVASGLAALAARREAATVAARVQQARSESESARERARAFQGRGEAGQTLAAQALLTTEAPPALVVAELSRLMPRDVRLESLRLAYGRRLEVEMRVSARAAGSYDEFVERLAGSPSFADVLPGDEAREGELRATVRAVWSGPGA